MSVDMISPCLWFDSEAEEAANFYVSIFPGSKIRTVNRFPDAGQEVHGKPAGSVMTVLFDLNGLPLTALNGGPTFTFNEAVSLQVPCETQEEIDHYWEALSAGGEKGQCGWLKDRFGLSWQVFPRQIDEWISSGDEETSKRVMNSMLKMTRIDLAELERARDGKVSTE